MSSKNSKFLEFNGKIIYFIDVNGTNWIAIKPICEALGVDFEAQRKLLKNDVILSQLPSEQTVLANDNKLRKMICLPEFYIYGWIFGINSQSKQLKEYKWTCYELLYNHFHGTITRREKLLTQKCKDLIEIEKIELSLSSNSEFQRLTQLKSNINKTKKVLISLDKEVTASQLELFN